MLALSTATINPAVQSSCGVILKREVCNVFLIIKMAGAIADPCLLL
jgi:hypothetical protein